MSQHRYTSAGITVILGYDRPGNYVHCAIWKGEERIYSSATDPHGLCKHRDVAYYRGLLRGMAIAIPESMFEQTMIDFRCRIANRNCLHTDSAFEISGGGK